MKSKILVDYDFDANETFLQLRLDGWNEDGGELPDKHLKNFVEQANAVGGLIIDYRGAGNALPQIRVGLSPAQDEKVEKIYQYILTQLKATKAELNSQPKNAESIETLEAVIDKLNAVKEYIDIDLKHDYTR